MNNNPLSANFRLGFLGAGQLARMSALQAFRYGIQIGVFSDREENEPVQFMTPPFPYRLSWFGGGSRSIADISTFLTVRIVKQQMAGCNLIQSQSFKIKNQPDLRILVRLV